MSDLRPPATGTEARLQAILEELRAIHGLLEDRLPAVVAAAIDERFVPGGIVAAPMVQPGGAPTSTSAAKVTVPTKRTRTRPPRAAS